MGNRIRLTILLVAASIVLGFASTASASSNSPTISVTPDTALSDGQTVSVSGEGWQEQDVQVVECGGADLTAHPVVGPVCTYFTYHVDVRTDADGSFAPVNFVVKSLIVGTRYANGNHTVAATYDCSVANDCWIRAFSTSRGYRAATAPISFATP